MFSLSYQRWLLKGNLAAGFGPSFGGRAQLRGRY